LCLWIHLEQSSNTSSKISTLSSTVAGLASSSTYTPPTRQVHHLTLVLPTSRNLRNEIYRKSFTPTLVHCYDRTCLFSSATQTQRNRWQLPSMPAEGNKISNCRVLHRIRKYLAFLFPLPCQRSNILSIRPSILESQHVAMSDPAYLFDSKDQVDIGSDPIVTPLLGSGDPMYGSREASASDTLHPGQNQPHIPDLTNNGTINGNINHQGTFNNNGTVNGIITINGVNNFNGTTNNGPTYTYGVTTYSTTADAPNTVDRSDRPIDISRWQFPMTDFRKNDPPDPLANQEIRDCHELEMRQQPQRARIVVRGKEKGKHLSSASLGLRG